MNRLFQSRLVLALWFLAFGLLTRAGLFGHPNYFGDETFYRLAGQRWQAGLLPYADVWDRKGPGLFLTYRLIAEASHSIAAYQIAAWLFASATAYIIARIARLFTGAVGALLAGTVYLAALLCFGGGGGQTPVFYNLFIALAALIVLRAQPALPKGKLPSATLAAMALAGIALTFKQTAIFEAAFLGLFAMWQNWRSGTSMSRLMSRATAMALAGIAPFALFALYFAAQGHFAEFWHAMVSANLTKSYNPGNDIWVRIGALALLAAPLLVSALAGMILGPGKSGPTPHQSRAFVAGWLIAAMAGVAVVPNYYEHYMLPLLVPLCVASAMVFGRGIVGISLALFATVYFAFFGRAFDFARTAQAKAEIEGITAQIRARNPHPRLLVYEGPMQLYEALDSYPPSPLFDNLHLYFPVENNTSHLDTRAEMERILSWRPDVVITFHAMPPGEENQRTASLVHAYTRQCKLWFTADTHEAYASHLVDVYGDCAGGSTGGTSKAGEATGR